MAAFLIAEIREVVDEKLYADYRARVDVTVRDAGGGYLVRGGAVDVLEGSWHPGRLVIVQFASAEAARSWWAGRDYRELKALRERATRTNMIVVEGVHDGRRD